MIRFSYRRCTTLITAFIPLTSSGIPLRIHSFLGSPVGVNIISWESRCVIRTALLYIVGSIVLCPLLAMDNLIVCQLLRICCIISLTLVLIV